MALIEHTLEGKIDKVKKAISRIQAYAFDVPVRAIVATDNVRFRVILSDFAPILGHPNLFFSREAAEKALAERSGK